MGAPQSGGSGTERETATPRTGRAGRASGRIVDQLRVRIRSGELAAGDRLPPERELCEQYGVSRVTIREALRVLEAGGLLDIRLGSHGGAFVTAPTASRVADAIEDYLALSDITDDDVREARLVVETGVLPLACQRARPSDNEQLARLCEELEHGWRSGRFDARTALEFHLALMRVAGNRSLEVVLRPLCEQLLGAAESGHGAGTVSADVVVSAHREVAEAVRASDSARATAALREHLKQSVAGD